MGALMNFGLHTSYKYRRTVNNRASALAQWQLIALAAAWGLMLVATYANVVGL